MNLPSKELLSEVLETDVDEYFIEENTLFYGKDFQPYIQYRINLYELAYKCKEWAMDNGYEISSSKPIVPNDEGKQVFNYWWIAIVFKFDGGYDAPKQIISSSFTGLIEPEAIFKACQWILDNKAKQ